MKPTRCDKFYRNMLSKYIARGHVIDRLNRSFAAHSSTVVIYYFFDSSEKKSLQASAFLRCILHQAITVDNLLPDSQRRLESLFEDQIGESETATDDLGQLFYHFLRKFKCAFLLIDGLDEVSKTEQRYVKALLTTIQTIDSARIIHSFIHSFLLGFSRDFRSYARMRRFSRQPTLCQRISKPHFTTPIM
jgi:hypothetical protein